LSAGLPGITCSTTAPVPGGRRSCESSTADAGEMATPTPYWPRDSVAGLMTRYSGSGDLGLGWASQSTWPSADPATASTDPPTTSLQIEVNMKTPLKIRAMES